MFDDEYNIRSLQKVRVRDFDMYITPRYQYHYVQNKYEPFSSEIVLNYLKQNSVFIDIGAHFGYYSLLASRISGVKIIAVEPVPTTYKILSKNIKMNNVKGSIHNCAISDRNKTKLLNITEASDSVGFYQHPMTKTKKTSLVRCLTVDTLLKDQKKVNFIKIDVEGHEMAVLRGMKTVLKKNANLYLLIEFCPQLQINAGHKPVDIFEELEGLGFEIYIVDEAKNKYYRLTNNKYNYEELLGDNTYCNLFCVPKNKSKFISFISHTNLTSGAERTLLELASKIKDEGAVCHMILPKVEGPLVKKLEGSGISYDRLDYVWWTDQGEKSEDIFSKTIINLINYLDEFQKINPSLVFTNTSVIPWGALLAKIVDTPHIWSIHEFGYKDHGLKYYLPIDEVRKFINVTSDYIIYNSKAIRREYENIIPSKKGEILYPILYNPIPNKLFGKDRIYQEARSLKIILVGFIAESKGQDQAVKAVLKLLNQGKKIELLLLGSYKTDDAYYLKIQKLIKKNKSNRIYCLDHVDNPHDYIALADIVLVCSRNEAFGRGAVEGMLLGKPLIISNRGAYRELVKDGVNGYSYRYGDIDNLAETIEIFITSPQKLLSFGRRGRNHALSHIINYNYSKKIYDISRRLAASRRNNFFQTITFTQMFFGKYLSEMSKNYANEHELLQKILVSKFYKFWRWYRKVVEKLHSYLN